MVRSSLLGGAEPLLSINFRIGTRVVIPSPSRKPDNTKARLKGICRQSPCFFRTRKALLRAEDLRASSSVMGRRIGAGAFRGMPVLEQAYLTPGLRLSTWAVPDGACRLRQNRT